MSFRTYFAFYKYVGDSVKNNVQDAAKITISDFGLKFSENCYCLC